MNTTNIEILNEEVDADVTEFLEYVEDNEYITDLIRDIDLDLGTS